MSEEYELKLTEIAEGGLQEKFNEVHQKVIENIHDPNTDHKAKRTVTIKLTYEADKNRETIGLQSDVSCKTAPPVGVASTLIVGADNDGQIVGKELRSGMRGQSYFDDEAVKQDDGEKIFDFKSKEAKQK